MANAHPQITKNWTNQYAKKIKLLLTINTNYNSNSMILMTFG